MVWIYLWMPLITILLWALGFGVYARYIQHDAVREIVELKHVASIYASVIGIMGGSLLLWARVEFWRFRNINRRSPPLPTSVEELAVFAELSATEMAAWQISRRVIAHHDEHGRLITADILE